MEDFVKAVVLENDIEAQLLTSILREREIPHRLQSYHDTAFDGLHQAQKGWGMVAAPEAFVPQIRDILDELRRTARDTSHETALGPR